jgi:hypothetical protein
MDYSGCKNESTLMRKAKGGKNSFVWQISFFTEDLAIKII